MTPLEALGVIVGAYMALTGLVALVLRGETRRCESGKVGSCQCFPSEDPE